MDEKIVLWIDENQMALDTWTAFFKNIFGEGFLVISEIPQEEIGAMIKRIQSEKNLVAIIADQRLNEAGAARYTGIELAEAVRRFNPKIPIYILTNHANDIGADEHSVEYVLEKDSMILDDYLNTIAARVRRHADVYMDILSEREQRFDELLRKSIESTLSEKEVEEFKELDFWRSKPLLAEEEPWAIKMKDKLDEHENIVRQLQKEIEQKKGGE